MKRWMAVLLAGLGALWMAAHLQGCAGGGAGSAAQKVYVKPGEHDKYYAFLSGGHSGQVFVYGLPSSRHCRRPRRRSIRSTPNTRSCAAC